MVATDAARGRGLEHRAGALEPVGLEPHVGVHQRHEVGLRRTQPGVRGAGETRVRAQLEHPHAGEVLADVIRRAVLRAVVHDDHGVRRCASGRARIRGSRRASGGRSSRESQPRPTGTSGRRAYAQGVARLRSGRLISPALGALALLLAFLQRPGDAYSDTRLELSADPGLFLSRVADMWSSTTDLGHVQSGQFVGYLFPMGPWFAAADALGISIWVAQRVWLGLLLALAAWGVVRLMDELYRPERGVAHVVAGPALPAQPVHRDIHEPWHRHAARLRGAPLARPGGASRSGQPARLALAGRRSR